MPFNDYGEYYEEKNKKQSVQIAHYKKLDEEAAEQIQSLQTKLSEAEATIKRYHDNMAVCPRCDCHLTQDVGLLKCTVCDFVGRVKGVTPPTTEE